MEKDYDYGKFLPDPGFGQIIDDDGNIYPYFGDLKAVLLDENTSLKDFIKKLNNE